MKKMPEVPPECGLKRFVVPSIFYVADQWGTFTLRFDTRREQGKAALTGYCMAVIDVLIDQCWALEREDYPRKLGEPNFWFQQIRALSEWRQEWSRYGGFSHA